MKILSKKTRDAVAILALIGVISLLHYSTDIAFAYFHDIYKILYYVPIILAAFRFGIKGGLLVALGITAIYTPHITGDWFEHPEIMINRFVEMIIFVVMAVITGRLVENERKEREQHIRTAQELKTAYEKLETHSEYLAEVEEQLRAAERLATLGELTASLAHEVRNPLAAIKGTTEILRDDYPENGEHEDFFDLLVDDIERIEAVIRNYLGQVVPSGNKNEQFEVVQAASAVAQILQSRVRKEEKSLVTGLPDKTFWIRGDEVKFRQIILNLLLNALGATAARDRIHLELKSSISDSDAPPLQLLIRDTGRGMKAGELQDIFKPFYTTREGGTGLGLPIVKRIADEYGWRIDIRSEWGEGTVVKLILS